MKQTLIIMLLAVMASGQAMAAETGGDNAKATKAPQKKQSARKKKQEDVVQIGGMSIIGNRELPKSLYIVPWKDSNVDSETDLSRDLLNERAEVVDQDEFRRQLNYYDLSK
jgi:hypothetical protein